MAAHQHNKNLDKAINLYAISLFLRIGIIGLGIVLSMTQIPQEWIRSLIDAGFLATFFLSLPLLIILEFFILVVLTYTFNAYIRHKTGYALRQNIFGRIVPGLAIFTFMSLVLPPLRILLLLTIITVCVATFIQIAQVTNSDLVEGKPGSAADVRWLRACILFFLIAPFALGVLAIGVPAFIPSKLDDPNAVYRQAARSSLEKVSGEDRGPIILGLRLRAADVRPHVGECPQATHDYDRYDVTIEELTFFGINTRTYVQNGCYFNP